MLEKLLRSTEAPHVYVLLRPRRGKTPGERLATLLRSPLFHLLRPGGAGAGGPKDEDGDGCGGAGGGPRRAGSEHGSVSSGGRDSLASAAAGSGGDAPDEAGAGAAGAAGRGLLALDPRVLLRVTAIAGDISLPGLGLSDADRALLTAHVDTVIHCAAGARG